MGAKVTAPSAPMEVGQKVSDIAFLFGNNCKSHQIAFEVTQLNCAKSIKISKHQFGVTGDKVIKGF